ncbi:hypothetical protein RSAG8_09893, partial [Rhizoctonia solani AG-8 WAC10335]
KCPGDFALAFRVFQDSLTISGRSKFILICAYMRNISTTNISSTGSG